MSVEIGTLACVTLRSTITAVSNLSIRNLDSMQRDYEFLYTQAISFSGPGGMFSNANNSLHYGPNTLDPFGTGTDSIHYGPDTPFKNQFLSKTVGNVVPYLGTGNVTINFTNTGSTLLLQGSNNYQSTVSTFAWGDFRLSYYWCSPLLLATGMKNFYATKKDKNVFLQWTTENEPLNTNYEIQISLDGHGFSSLTGIATRNPVSEGAAVYEFQYQAGNNYEGKLFFRIKQIKPGGQVAYSSIRAIDFSAAGEQSVTVSPNPVIKNMTIGFRRPQTGELRVELVNGLGQTLYSRQQTFTGQAKLEVRLDQNTQPGIYYLRIHNLKTNERLIQKIILQ